MDTFSGLMDRLGATAAGRHVHEFAGSTAMTGKGREQHNHRLAGVTGPATPCGQSHAHDFASSTDGVGHYHLLAARTAPAVAIGGGRHIHPFNGQTSVDLDHEHRFELATFAEAATT